MAVVDERYGEALLELAVESGQLSDYLDEAVVLKGVLLENPELTGLFVNPKITLEEKIDVVEKCFEGRFTSDICGMIKLVITNGRAGELEKILDWFVLAAKEKLGIGIVYVKSADELNDTTKKALENKMLQTTGYKKLEMHYSVEKELIGGLQVRLGDRIIDNTIRTRLDLLTKELRG